MVEFILTWDLNLKEKIKYLRIEDNTYGQKFYKFLSIIEKNVSH